MEDEIICRFCLSTGTIHVNIFGDQNLINKIEDCLNFKVNEGDMLPKVICKMCLDKIIDFSNFKETCFKSGQLLQRQYDKNKTPFESFHNKNEDNTKKVNKVKMRRVENKVMIYKVDDSMKEIIGENEYVCDICSKKFYAFFDYYDHQDIHEGQNLFQCNKCHEVFNKRVDLIDHDSRHKISCHICKIEVLPKSLPAHLLIHTDTYKCPHCGLRNVSKASLEKHIKAIHAGIKGFVCHICGKQNSCQSSMNRHMAYHSNERPYQCKYCEFNAKSLNIVQVHTSRKHFAEKRVCEICAKIFKSQPSLIQHMKRIHTKRKHVCEICKKTFIEKYNLTKHMKKHIGQRLHECKVCKKDFFTVRQLKEHMHSHREGCVDCPKCNKIFFYKKYFNKHILKCAKN